MKRQGPRQALRTIKSRAQVNAFTYSPQAFQNMFPETLYEEDVKRAFSTASLLEVREDSHGATHYILRGFGMDEEPVVLICRFKKRLIEVVDLYRD